MRGSLADGAASAYSLQMSYFSNIHRLAPANGQPADSLVVLLHGYGADGHDLIDLGREWRASLPRTEFMAPDAPIRCEINPSGRQWWSLQEAMEAGFSAAGLSLALRETGAEAQRRPLTEWIDAERTRLGIPWGRVALVGFSQGTMLALHIGLRLPETPAAIVGFSGVLLAPHSLLDKAIVRPPVLLVHGMLDMVVPFAAMNIAEAQLRAAGIKVTSLARPQLGHSIDRDSIVAAGAFLGKALAGNTDRP